MKEIDEMTHEYINECIRRLGIHINEQLLPHTLKRDFDKDMKDIWDSFGIVEAFECMEFDVETVAMIIDLHDAICEDPLLVMSDYQIEKLLTDYILFDKQLKGEQDVDELSDYEEKHIELFLQKINKEQK